eukprot:gnl/Chilomastix_cuspidata/6495.p3 GENE.gnl/Chilomastix_cuspidata/6495~~gnl/Chilomastix_cuspidata/6495.p3  ORF type:complete len:137 (-),score=1.24 gnl/Chilomastix_cuspidata/6495:1482-1892(-)
MRMFLRWTHRSRNHPRICKLTACDTRAALSAQANTIVPSARLHLRSKLTLQRTCVVPLAARRCSAMRGARWTRVQRAPAPRRVSHHRAAVQRAQRARAGVADVLRPSRKTRREAAACTQLAITRVLRRRRGFRVPL